MMWAYNSMLKCTVNGGRNVLSSAWQGSPLIRKRALSTTPVQKIFLSAKRPFIVVAAVFRACAQGKVLKRDIHMSSTFMQFAVDTNIAKDVIIFKYDNVKLHKMITLFGIINYFMFMSITGNIYTLLTTPKDTGEESSESVNDSDGSSYSPVYTEPSNTSSSLEVAEGSTESNEPISSTFILKALCGVTFTLGIVMLCGSFLYCNHVVRYIVLHKGGKKVTVVAHGFFGKNRFHSMDIDQVTCRGNRAISSAVLLNVKGKYFSYILDKKGSYTNPQLFDATVGVLRDLRK